MSWRYRQSIRRTEKARGNTEALAVLPSLKKGGMKKLLFLMNRIINSRYGHHGNREPYQLEFIGMYLLS